MLRFNNSSFFKFDFQSKRRIKYISNCNYRLLTHTYYIKYSIVLGNAIFNTFTPLELSRQCGEKQSVSFFLNYMQQNNWLKVKRCSALPMFSPPLVFKWKVPFSMNRTTWSVEAYLSLLLTKKSSNKSTIKINHILG